MRDDTDVKELSMEEIKERVQAAVLARQNEEAREEAIACEKLYKYVRPLGRAATELIEYLQNPEGRFMLGLPEIDMMTRGFGRGELVYVLGHAHSGKTQVVLNAINKNRDRRVLYFTPDEPAALVLTKLVALVTGTNAERLEELVKANDTAALNAIRRVAEHDFKNLIVIDDALTIDQMAVAHQEAVSYWGGDEPDLAVVDFLELIPSEHDEGVYRKSQDLKKWAKDIGCPVICLHQASRNSGGRGQPMNMMSGRYGGETDAIFVLGVYRRRDDMSLDQWDRDKAKDLITVQVIKNKRPPNRTGEHDYFMEGSTGFVRPLIDGDLGIFTTARGAINNGFNP